MHLLLLLTVINCVWEKGLNSGSPLPLSLNGVLYEADDHHDTDSSPTLNIRHQYISNPLHSPLLRTARTTHKQELRYSLPVDGDASYDLVLSFVQLEATRTNCRAFYVRLGSDVVAYVDVFAEVGRGTLFTLEIPFTLANQIILYQGESMLNAYHYNRKEVVVVLQKHIGTPKIQAILVRKHHSTPIQTTQNIQQSQKIEKNQKKHLFTAFICTITCIVLLFHNQFYTIYKTLNEIGRFQRPFTLKRLKETVRYIIVIWKVYNYQQKQQNKKIQ